MPYLTKPTHSGYNLAIEYSCDNCGKTAWEKPSHYKKKVRHFCSMSCYAQFRKEKMCFTEQMSYKGVRQLGESKQVYHRNYCKSNPENIAHLKARRYARERNADGSHTLVEWNKLKELHNNLCAQCKQPKPLTKDHKIPLSMGGSDYISNIQPLCRSCNSKKHNHIHENPELLNQ